eukprot:1037490-Alexandrium_andersonii.AAC.1
MAPPRDKRNKSTTTQNALMIANRAAAATTPSKTDSGSCHGVGDGSDDVMRLHASTDKAGRDCG